MRWNKHAFIIVLIVFSVSYIFSQRSEEQKSNKVKTQQIEACKAQKADYCDLIDLYHKSCFDQNYRSWMKTKRFYDKAYETCLKNKIASFQKSLK